MWVCGGFCTGGFKQRSEIRTKRQSVFHGKKRRCVESTLQSQRCPGQSRPHWEDWVSVQELLFAMEALHVLDNWRKVIIIFRDDKDSKVSWNFMRSINAEGGTVCSVQLLLALKRVLLHKSVSTKNFPNICFYFLAVLWFSVWGFPGADAAEYHFMRLSEEQIWWYCSSVLLSWGHSTSETYFPSLLHNILGTQMTPGTLCCSVIAIIMCFLTFPCGFLSFLTTTSFSHLR